MITARGFQPSRTSAVNPVRGWSRGLSETDRDVGPPHQVGELGALAGVGHVQLDAPLAPVEVFEQDAAPYPVHGIGERRRGAHRVACPRRLDLQHVRAEVAEQPRAVGPGDAPADLQYPHAGQRLPGRSRFMTRDRPFGTGIGARQGRSPSRTA